MPPSMIAITNIDTVVKGVTVSEEKIPVNCSGDTSNPTRTIMHKSTQGNVNSTTLCRSRPQRDREL